MARNELPPESFEQLAAELLEASNTLSGIASFMRESGMPRALVHAATTQNHHVPSILESVAKMNVDVRVQVRAYLAGVPSSAEIHVQQNANAKKSAARKARKKPAS